MRMAQRTFILFCEDCGEKNRVAADVINSDGRVMFECTSCHYMNNYPVIIPDNEDNTKDQPE